MTAPPPDQAGRRAAIRSYVVRAGRMGSGQVRALAELAPRYVLPFEPRPADFSDTFGRKAPHIVGGFVILWAERRTVAASVRSVDDMTTLDALKVGLVQCLAMIPGTSRSGATIIGGMLLGLDRKVATDFSFYLAIPTLVGAGAYSLYKERALLSMADLPLFGVGLLFSFISAWICVRWLLRYIASHTFTPFAWYRIAFGVVVLVTAQMGWVTWAD